VRGFFGKRSGTSGLGGGGGGGGGGGAVCATVPGCRVERAANLEAK